MTVDEFIALAKAELELFRSEIFREGSPIDPLKTPPFADEVLELAELDGKSPSDIMSDEDLWWSEFSGWRMVDPDDPDGDVE